MKSLVCLFFLALASYTYALKEGDCEVCISVLKRFRETLAKDETSDPKKIEAAFKNYCKDLKLKENRFVSPFDILIW